MAGRINVNAVSNTIPLSADINADDFTSPQLVKYIELVTSYPIIRNESEWKQKPDATISATSLLHPNAPAYVFPDSMNIKANIAPITNIILLVISRSFIAVSISPAPQHILTMVVSPCPKPIASILKPYTVKPRMVNAATPSGPTYFIRT